MAPVILVVADDRGTLEAMERGVGAHYGDGYRLVQESRAERALEACENLRVQNQDVALLLAATDVPGMGGPAFLARARALHPEAGRVLLVTRNDTDAAIVARNEIGVSRYLLGPFDPPEERLHPVLDELLADWRARAAVPYRRVREVMDTEVVRIHPGASLHEAAAIVAESGVGDLMVVDEHGVFGGVLSEGDVLRNALPDIDAIVAAGGTLFDGYQLFLRRSSDLYDKPITPLVISDPLVAHPDDHVAKVTVVLIDRQIRRLPVMENGRLVGTVSRTNICQAVVERHERGP